MRALVQRALGASVTVEGETVGSFEGPGLVVLVGFTDTDGDEQIDYLVRRLVKLQILEDVDPASSVPCASSDQGPEPTRGPRELSILEADAPVLLVSQFTLYGSVKKGRKPSWTHAAPGEIAEPLYEKTAQKLRAEGVRVETGKFGAMMQVSLTNDGPFTLWIEK